MLTSLPVLIAVGAILGFLSGLGVGGGSLLILWLTLALQTPADTARAMNLLFFLPPAAAACFFRWKQGTLDLKTVLPGILSGCVCAGLFAWISGVTDTGLLRRLFGGILILTGIRELCYHPKNTGRHS